MNISALYQSVLVLFEEIIANDHKTLSKIVATFEADAKRQQYLLQEILLSLWQALAPKRTTLTNRSI